VWPMPALFTNMSRPPKSSSAVSTMAATSLSTVTSAVTLCAILPREAATRSPAAPSRSAMRTQAPSATNLRAMPSPKPEPPPVTIAVLPASLTMESPLRSAVEYRHGLQGRKAVERLEALFPTVARALDAAEGQLHAAAGAIIVDEDLTGADGALHPELPAAIPRPDPGDEAIGRAIGDADRIGLVLEGDDDLDGTEDLLLRQAMIGGGAGEEGRADVMPALGRIGDDAALGRDGEAVLAGEGEIALDDLLLPARDDGPQFEIGQGRPRLEGAVAVGHAPQEGVMDRPLDQDPRGRGAGLARVLYAGIDEEGQGRVQIGIGEDDLGGFAAELEGDGDGMARGGGLHQGAGRNGSREGDMVDAAMGKAP